MAGSGQSRLDALSTGARRLASSQPALTAFIRRRVLPLLPFVSMVWGLVSGILLKRDFAHSRQVVAYLALLVAASVLLRIWLEYTQSLGGKTDALRGVRKFLVNKPGLVSGAAHFATQCAVQYIAMFCVPLLVLAKAWTTLGGTLLLAGISLVDPWWAGLAALGWCMALVRSFTAVLAMAFAFPIFFPQELPYFYPAVAAVAFLASLPGDLWLHVRRVRVATLGPALLVGSIILAEASVHAWVRIPLLSVWLQDPSLGMGLEDHQLREPWLAKEDRAVLAPVAADEDGVCCYTPVISPSGVEAPLTHEWLVDGSVVDRIALAPIRGLGHGKDKAFRTFSCKHHLPSLDTIHTLGCRVYLDHGLYLGQTEVSFH